MIAKLTDFSALKRFRIHCCPNTPGMDFGGKEECYWENGASGEPIWCYAEETMFGRCSTAELKTHPESHPSAHPDDRITFCRMTF